MPETYNVEWKIKSDLLTLWHVRFHSVQTIKQVVSHMATRKQTHLTVYK